MRCSGVSPTVPHGKKMAERWARVNLERLRAEIAACLVGLGYPRCQLANRGHGFLHHQSRLSRPASQGVENVVGRFQDVTGSAVGVRRNMA